MVNFITLNFDRTRYKQLKQCLKIGVIESYNRLRYRTNEFDINNLQIKVSDYDNHLENFWECVDLYEVMFVEDDCFEKYIDDVYNFEKKMKIKSK